MDSVEQINDAPGHDAGDRLLIGFDGQLEASVRPHTVDSE